MHRTCVHRKERSAYRILFKKSQEESSFGHPGKVRRIILKYILEKMICEDVN
jgi:hypothetical protein